jgi:hypothetical protein
MVMLLDSRFRCAVRVVSSDVPHIIIFGLLLLALGCHHPIEPPSQLEADTTSHDISWQMDVLGDGSSILRDVAILNDTLAYAIGQIYLRDSLGNWDGLPYNLAKWNGHNWTLTRATTYFRGNDITVPLNRILVLSPASIWLTGGGVPIYGDGEHWTMYHLWDMGVLPPSEGGVYSLFATDNEIYFGGEAGGNMVRYAGGVFQKLNSGTRMKTGDIYGARDPFSGTMEVLAVASNPYDSLSRKILQISGTTVTTISDIDIKESLSTLWFVPGKQYYVAGSGIYQKNALGDAKWRNGPLDIATCYVEGMTGTALNDIFTVGDFGEILHWNGSTWHNYIDQTRLPTGLLYRVAIKGDLIFAVGENNQRAVVARGRRLR